MSPTDSRVSTAGKSLLLIGPQQSRVSPKDLTELRSTITNTPDLAFLRDSVTELESLWPIIVEAHPELKKVPGDASLSNLRLFFEGGEMPLLGQPPARNIVFDVVTVLSHVVDFWRLATARVQNGLFHSSDLSSQLQNIQGFCIGFLTAAAISGSKTEADFQRYIAAALRLAVCVGALVELDDAKIDNSHNHVASISVGWGSESEFSKFKKALDGCQSGYVSCVTDKNRVTVTIFERDSTSFGRELSDLGLSVQPINLQGRYHYRPAHEDAARNMKELCGRDPRFQLSAAAELILPLRSNIDGDLISTGALHEVALESILLQQCQWFRTVQAAIADTGVDVDSIVPVGAEGVVPRSVTKSLLPHGKANGICDELTDGVKSSTRINHDINDTSAIAIIGMACRYPDADSLEDFWELISAGKSAVRPLPEDRFKLSELRREPKGPFWGNFLRHPELFDHRFFGISGREAKYMDPQQRLLLQVAYEAMESSGYFGLRSSPENFPPDIGCYIGVSPVDYSDNIACYDATAFSVLGTLRACISGRVSHHFGWSGPSITYDTACSSGSVAIHSAISNGKAIKGGECSMALAGGVNVITSPTLFQNLAAASFLSPTGASKAFDANANGYCRGEGAGLVVLKPLARALIDGDSILATITGSALNQGANCSPITVPVSDSQSTLYRKALSISGTDPKEVSFVEAHGTGTPVGDPIECESIRRTFGGPHRTHELFFGSVKDNVGHTETASGAAALIKIVLMIQKRTIPKQANFTQLNSKIPPLEPDRMAIPKHTQPWAVPRRIAVVNNYGAAGNNAAMVVEDTNLEKSDVPALDGHATSIICIADSDLPFFISAKTPESLIEYCGILKSNLPRIQESHGVKTTLNVAYNLSVKQNRGFEYNYTFTASSLSELASNLDNALPADFKKLSTDRRPVVLCIGGQNGGTAHLNGDMLQNNKLLQKHLIDCERECQALGLSSLFPMILRPEPVRDLVNLHCILFSLQYASAKSWLDCGLTVDTIIGHSFGQLTALVVANALSLSDGLRLISERARLIQSSWGKETGAMLSVEGDPSNVERLLEQTKSQYSCFVADIACYNGPRTIVLSGDRASIDAVEEVSKSGGFSAILKLMRLKNTHAFHSRLVDSIAPDLRKVAATLNFKQPSIRIEACSKDQDWNQPIDADKIVQHSRMPVYFNDAVQKIAERLNSCVWVEAGSASPITSMARRALTVTESDSDGIFQPINLGAPNAFGGLAKATCTLWAAGVKVQFWPFHHNQRDLFTWINLPPYQFQKTPHWLQYTAPSIPLQEKAPTVTKNEPLQLLSLLERNSESVTFGINCAHDMFKLCTEGHAVLGQSLCPASMYVEMAVRAATLLKGKASSVAPCMRDLNISSPLSISTKRQVFLHLVSVNRGHDTWEFTVVSRGQSNAAVSTKHAAGVVSLNISDKDFQASRMQSFKRLVGQARHQRLSKTPGSNVLNGRIIYQVLGQVVDYAFYYKGVEEVVSKGNEAVGIVTIPDGQSLVMNEAACDPITLDIFLQVAGIHINCLSERNDGDVYIFTELGELFLSETFIRKRRSMRTWDVYSTFEQGPGRSVVNDIFISEPETGDLHVMYIGAIFQSIPIKSLAKTLEKLNSGSNATDSQNSKNAPLNRPIKNETYNSPKAPKIEAPVQSNEIALSNNSVQFSQADILQQVRKLLSGVLEAPLEDIQPSATLTDLGIDSLMSTEISNEIKGRFDIAISVSDFAEIDDVQSLAQHLGQSASTPQPQPFTNAVVDGQGRGASSFRQIQEMFSDILGVSASEIAADMLLSDLGIDSLMATEVLNEIKKRFDVAIAADEFQDYQDVGALANCLQLSSSGTSSPVQADRYLDEQPNGRLNGQPDGHSQGKASLPATELEDPLFLVARDSFVKFKRNFDVISRDTLLANFRQLVYPAQMELVVTYVVEAFKSMGCPLATLNAGEKVPDVIVLSKHHKVKNQIYRILEDADLVKRDSIGGFVRTDTPVPQGESERLHQEIVVKFPQHAFEHNLLASTGSKLADCLTGRADPLAVLFGSAKARALMENVYTNAPMFKTGTINLAQYLVDIFNNFDDTRSIRILELGAGTGGTTKHLIECFAGTQRKFQYTFTDLSSSLVAAARKKFSEYNFMQYMVLDVEKEPAAQFLNQYDVVISTNCIHATQDLTRSCTNINKVLRPDGILCLVELTRNLYWFDLTFGLLEGWWLFEDGRQHALANENLWKKHLSRSGFRWIDWTVGSSDESNILRVITASPSDTAQVTTETVEFKRAGDISLQADLYYPENVVTSSQKALPVALMIHGGGHVMLSRQDIRPPQTRILLDAGFLPVSVDYRLCPETTLLEGPMRDVCDALSWARTILPKLKLQRPDIRIDGDRVVAVGWSTGGHLALTLGFTAPQSGIQPPDAILAFYCPLDYEDPFWTQPNIPFEQEAGSLGDRLQYNILEGVYDSPITAYNPPTTRRALGGWMAPSDPRSRIALHMNWKGRALRVLLNGLSRRQISDSGDPTNDLPDPGAEQIQSISPLAQIRRGAYRVPTFIIHGTKDDLIPWQQAVRTFEALQQQDVTAEIRILEGGVHLFDLYQSYKRNQNAVRIVKEGYEFLRMQVAD